MRPRTLTAIAAVGLALAAPVALAGHQSTTIGTGVKTCVLGPGVDCRGVVHRWAVEHHGNLRKVRFTKADLRGADFRGADLRGADFRGATLRHADMRGANLRGARFDVVKPARRGANEMQAGTGCLPMCAATDLTDVDFNLDDLEGANFDSARIDGTQFAHTKASGASFRAVSGDGMFYDANLTGADFTNAELDGSHFDRAILTGAIFANATLHQVTCPNESVISSPATC